MKTPKIISELARNLRNNMTPAEKILWEHIRRDALWYRFLRQKPLYLYTDDSWLDRFIIPDFYCHQKQLIIEVDGSIHTIPQVYELDRIKEDFLQNQWIEVWRISNADILGDIDWVLSELHKRLS